MSNPVLLQQSPLSIEDLNRVARDGVPLAVDSAVMSSIKEIRGKLNARLNASNAMYGINTGFGSLSRQRIAQAQLGELQHNLLRSHAAGIGEPLPTPVVRGMLTLLAASLCRGRSGVRPLLIEQIVAMLNAGVTPIVPGIGSVGASGDLAPLSHAALVLIGEGQAEYQGKRITGGEALAAAGLEPISLGAKEGLALINGTHLMAARAALLLHEFDRLVLAAVCATGMTMDACRTSHGFLDARVYDARAQVGPAQVAARLREALSGSTIVESHRENDPRVQDPYSFRCAPIVLGSAIDAAEWIRSRVELELGAVTDNPLIFDDGAGEIDIVSAGNFHGMPMAIPLDTLTIAVAHVAGIAERRTYHMLSAFDAEAKLAPFLSPSPGLHSGLMIAQYTSAAACNELIGLSTPASVANISTSAGVEDYNSFGPRSAAKADRAMDLARHVIAIELVCSAQGLEAHRPLVSGKGIETAHEVVRSVVRPLDEDRPPSDDILAVAALIQDGAFGESGAADR